MFAAWMMADGGCEREEEREGAGGKSEEEVYTMLYKEVDAEGNGVVSIESLVAYLHQMQLGSGQGDQVFDSHEDVSGTSLSVGWVEITPMCL